MISGSVSFVIQRVLCRVVNRKTVLMAIISMDGASEPQLIFETKKKTIGSSLTGLQQIRQRKKSYSHHNEGTS